MKNYFIAIILLLCICFGCSKSHEEYFIEANSYYNNEEFDKANKLYIKACEKGSLKSCMKLANIYKDDSSKSDNFYKKSYILADKDCNSNDKYACKILGFLYKHGLGIDLDYNKADVFVMKACDLGDSISCYNTAKSKYDNITSYVNYMDKACQLDFDNACLIIGNVYLTGFNENMQIIEKNMEKGLNYILKSCQLNSALCVNLADIYISGENISQNYKEAIKYYNMALGYYEQKCKENNDEYNACKSIKNIKSKYMLDDKAVF